MYKFVHRASSSPLITHIYIYIFPRESGISLDLKFMDEHFFHLIDNLVNSDENKIHRSEF